MNEAQAGASRVKIAGIMSKTKKWSRSLVQAKTSQILTIQDRLLKKIMLPSLGSAFFVCLCFCFSFPHLYSVLNFKKENVTVKFPRRSYFSLWAVWVPPFHWMAAYPVDILFRWSRHMFTNLQMPKTHNCFSQEYHVLFLVYKPAYYTESHHWDFHCWPPNRGGRLIGVQLYYDTSS